MRGLPKSGDPGAQYTVVPVARAVSLKCPTALAYLSVVCRFRFLVSSHVVSLYSIIGRPHQRSGEKGVGRRSPTYFSIVRGNCSGFARVG